MPYSDLIRVTVLLTAGEATALAMIAVLATGTDETLTLAIGGGWWLVAAIIGVVAGRSSTAADAVRDVLTQAKTSSTLPAETQNRIALQRLWPIAASAVVAGGVGIFFPGVAAIGAGFALLVSLTWRHREAAVYAIEQRDGVRFYVLPGSALKPIQLMRSPGLYGDRAFRP